MKSNDTHPRHSGERRNPGAASDRPLDSGSGSESGVTFFGGNDDPKPEWQITPESAVAVCDSKPEITACDLASVGKQP